MLACRVFLFRQQNLFVLSFSYMTTRELSISMFSEQPSLGRLFSAIREVISAWISARRYQQLDFHELNEDEISDATRAKIAIARQAPDEDFVNV